MTEVQSTETAVVETEKPVEPTETAPAPKLGFKPKFKAASPPKQKGEGE